MIDKSTFYFFIIFAVPTVIQCISVVGPRIIRPFSSYSVAIAGGPRAYTLYVAVEGRKANGEQFTQGREVQIPAASSRLIELDIGDPGSGYYSLVARSTSGPLFSSSAPLVYQPRSFCVFVQTDKRVYQPSDTINFRIVALDKYLLPLTGNVDVAVLDAGGTPVREWAGLTLDTGLVTEELILADEPGLGEWTIQVEVRGQRYTRNILVADYVQPKFQMEMTLPNEVLFSDGRFTVNVTARHFNGLPVRGELTFSAYAVFFSGLLQPVIGSPARKVVNIDGQVQVTYDLKTDLDLAEDAARPLVVEAVLEEKDTLIRQNVSSRILLLRTPYRLKVTAANYFKPTIPFIVQIEVIEPSGKTMLVNDDVTVERLWDDGAPVNVTTLRLNKGRAMYTLVPDTAHVNSTLNLVVKYKDVSERVINVQRNEYSGGHFIGIEMLTSSSSDPSKSNEIRARVTATEPMDLMHYVVIGRGDILLVKTVELSPPRRNLDISITKTSRMSPGCVILAWYPKLDATSNSILSAAVYAPQNELLPGKVSISPITSTGVNPKPSSLLELRVSGEQGSHVALLGQDVNSIRAGLSGEDARGNGLDIHTIEREVESFSGLDHSIFKNDDFPPDMGIDLSGYTSSDVFKNAGIVILTDGVIIQNKVNEESSTDSPVESGTRPPLSGPYAFSRLPPPPSPRYYLTVVTQPTWTLANITIGNDGKGAKERWTQTTPGEFAIGAFSIHPTQGLDVAAKKEFTTSVPLHMSAELPTTLQKGETLAAVIILKTTLAVDTSVEVTFHNTDQYFEFEPLDNELDSTKKIELFRRVRVTIPARGSVSTAFLVTAVRTGEAPVIVEASGNGLSDSLFRSIDVKDGYEEEVFSWGLLEARRGPARANVTLDVARGLRAGGIWLQATGDLLSSAARAIRSYPTLAPAGDPTHALRPLALSCVLLDYLQATGQEAEAIARESRLLAAIGYQRLMAYRKPDGSFASETDAESEGDVWMTAVSLRWVSRCARHVQVSPSVSASAAQWLSAAQQSDGTWRSPSLSARNDPRAQTPLPLTTYALLALLHTKGSDILYKNNINTASDYIGNALSSDLDAYTLALIGGALSTARHSQAELALQLLDKHVNTTDGVMYWPRALSGSEWRNPWLKGNNFDATTAAWGLRTMLAARKIDEAVPIVRYLLQGYRPYDPDPDVVDSLAQFAETIKTSTKLRISVNVTGSEDTRQFQIGENNVFIIQTQPIRNSRSVSAVTEGRGLALVGLSTKASTNVTAPWPRYTLDPRVDQVSTKDRLQLSICFGFVAQGNETESGLALLTVQLPSGYRADINTLTELTSVRHVSSARVQHGGARVYAWVRADRTERCATLAAPRALPVARQRPGWATLEDLYDSSRRARAFYQAISSSACDVCRAWESCARACGSTASQRAPDDNSKTTTGTKQVPDHANTVTTPLTLISLILLATAAAIGI